MGSFLIYMAANVVSNHMADAMLGQGLVVTKLPFGIAQNISEYIINVVLVEDKAAPMMYPSVFQIVDAILPMKQSIMAKRTRESNNSMSADEFIAMDKIVERQLTVALLVKNVVTYFMGNGRRSRGRGRDIVVVNQEDFIRQGLCSDWVGKAGELYSNLKDDIRASLDENIFSGGGGGGGGGDITERMYDLFQNASSIFNSNITADVDEESVVAWFKSCLVQLANHYNTTTNEVTKIKTDEQVNDMMEKSNDVQKRLNDLKEIHAENLRQLVQIADVQKTLAAAAAAAGDNNSHRNTLVGDLSHIQGLADELRGINAGIESSINIFETTLLAKVNLGIFVTNGEKLTRTIADLIIFGKNLVPIEVAAAAAAGAAQAAAEIGKTTQKQT